MKHVVLMCVLAIVAAACKAKEENQAIETTIDPSTPIQLEETVDSVSNVRKDGTQTTTGSPLTIKQQLPSALEVYLDQNHGLWRYPTLSHSDIERVPAEEQGPYYLQGDFNNDNQEDYAVQIVERDSSSILAVLSTGDNTWQEYVLEKHPLTTINGQKRSLRYLTLASKAKKPHTLHQEGISIGMENSTEIYVYANGSFKKHQSKD